VTAEEIKQAVREALAESATAQATPAELTLDQAMRLANFRSRSAFYRWCRRRRVRPIAHGRYSARRIREALFS
jgi:hypothetical protein